MVKIVWTEIAINDLKEIFDFIAEDSVKYAIITSQNIYRKVQFISSNPYMGRVVPEFNEKFIREIIEGNYRIIYLIKNDLEADILRIFHSNRLLQQNSIL